MNYAADFTFPQGTERIIVPQHEEDQSVIQTFAKKLIQRLNDIQDEVLQNRERYESKYNNSLLDLLSSEGVLPTYSFPQNVVGFYIEGQNGDISQKPERALNIAISKYATGKILVVDKKTYKVGGIYSPPPL